LRGAARAAGVSQTAPYRHFADRRTLVAAVAEEGFRQLQQAMITAIQRHKGRMGLRGVAVAYVAFGLKHPALYRIMFGPEVARKADLPALQVTSAAVLTFVQRGIEELQRGKLIGKGDAAGMATATWAMLHGLVMLSLDGHTADRGLPHTELIAETTRIMMFGMAPR
jgi:AcrR family transcriptional regulator